MFIVYDYDSQKVINGFYYNREWKEYIIYVFENRGGNVYWCVVERKC